MKTLIIHFVFLVIACSIVSGCTCAGDEEMEKQGFPNLPLLDDSSPDDSTDQDTDDSLQDDDSLVDDSTSDDDSIDDDTSSDDTADDTTDDTAAVDDSVDDDTSSDDTSDDSAPDDDSSDDDTSSDDTADDTADDDSIDDDTGDRLLEIVDVITVDTRDHFDGPVSLVIDSEDQLHASYLEKDTHYPVDYEEHCTDYDLNFASGHFGSWNTSRVESGWCSRGDDSGEQINIGKSSNVILVQSPQLGTTPAVVYTKSYDSYYWAFWGLGWQFFGEAEGSINLWGISALPVVLFEESIENSGKGAFSFVDHEGGIHIGFSRYDYVNRTYSVGYAQYLDGLLSPEYFDTCYNLNRAVVVLDHSGNVHVVYDCHIDFYKAELRHASKETGQWVVRTVDSPPIGPSPWYEFCSINRIVESDGSLQMAYIAMSTVSSNWYGVLKYARYENGSWSLEVVDEGFDVSTASFALDEEGIAHIAYGGHVVYAGNQLGPLSIAENRDNTWTINSPIPSRIESFGALDMAFDSYQNLHVLYIGVYDYELGIDTSTLWHMTLPSSWP